MELTDLGLASVILCNIPALMFVQGCHKLDFLRIKSRNADDMRSPLQTSLGILSQR